MKKIMFLYEITLSHAGHGHHPRFNVVAEDIEAALAVVRGTDSSFASLPAQHVKTVVHVDCVQGLPSTTPEGTTP